MLTAGIIAEFNPFHAGHAWLIQKMRQAGATHVAVVMSGNFVQRGEPAILSKTARTRQALACGVDLVVELPAPWAVAGAETFARGGVALLDALGADWLCFGSECGSISKLQQAAEALLSPALSPILREELSKGMTFAKARQRAVETIANEEVAAVLTEPNNILGVEYCKAILTLHSALTPVTVKREGPAHDSPDEACGISSAGRIRSILKAGQPVIGMPDAAAAILRQELHAGRAPASLLRSERAVLARLRMMRKEDFLSLPDISEGLENRLYAASRKATSLEELYALIKTKRYPLSRIRRLVLAAYLGITAADTSARPPYLRILGMTGNGAALLPVAKATTKLPLFINSSDSFSLDSRGKNMIELEGTCYDLFSLCMPSPIACGVDKTAGLIKVAPSKILSNRSK